MRTAAGLFLAFLLLLSAGTSGAEAAERPDERKTILRVYTWSSYFSPDVLADFEDAHDCHVAIDLFDSNEAMLDDVVNGDRRFDLITPSSYVSQVMRKSGMLLDIDLAMIPNARHLDKEFVAVHSPDPELAYSIPYTRTVTGVGYNQRLYPNMNQSWAVFADPGYAGRTTMLFDMRETIGAALKYLGHSLNSRRREELEAAKQVVLEWKGNLLRFEVDESNIGLGTGELAAAQAYNGDVAVLMEAVPDIGFFVPREGAAISVDDFVITADSAQSDLAHAFINHMLDPANAARNMEGILFYMPVPEALARIPEELGRNPAFAIPEDRLDACETIRDVGPALEIYEEIWREAAEE